MTNGDSQLLIGWTRVASLQHRVEWLACSSAAQSVHVCVLHSKALPLTHSWLCAVFACEWPAHVNTVWNMTPLQVGQSAAGVGTMGVFSGVGRVPLAERLRQLELSQQSISVKVNLKVTVYWNQHRHVP